jgi:hypothetical protein
MHINIFPQFFEKYFGDGLKVVKFANVHVYLLEKWIHFNFSMIRENFYEF